jgi:hypothetical protein
MHRDTDSGSEWPYTDFSTSKTASNFYYVCERRNLRGWSAVVLWNKETQEEEERLGAGAGNCRTA